MRLGGVGGVVADIASCPSSWGKGPVPLCFHSFSPEAVHAVVQIDLLIRLEPTHFVKSVLLFSSSLFDTPIVNYFSLRVYEGRLLGNVW